MHNMPGTTKEQTCEEEYREEDDERTLQSLKQELKPQNKVKSSLSKRKVTNCLRGCNGNASSKKNIGNQSLKNKIVSKAIVRRAKTSKKPSSLSNHKPRVIGTKYSENTDDADLKPQKLKRRRRNKRKNNVDLDEAARLQKRTRYLLMKMKQEQNLIDAYSAEGWKGQSREKIRPEKELQRAHKQILKCKLGIREVIHQLDLLGSEGKIKDSVIAPDGSVHHEHIICAKCKLSETLPDNDIILCDGTCNCAFHQQCLDPPLLTENIPPNDEGWFCKFCKKKMEILEATNAHLGTHFPLDVGWEDVFKEEAALPDDGKFTLCPEEEWPGDDSEDDDYDPDRIEHSDRDCISRSGFDASDCSSSDVGSLEDEDLLALGRIDDISNTSLDNSHEIVDSDDNAEVICRPRQRAAVDYIKLYDEMFGKNATENEEITDDEDWGPRKRKRKAKEVEAASSPIGETDKRNSEEISSDLEEKQLIKKIKRPIFRLPHDAVEKLRLVFNENELPERSIRVDLSEQLGLEFEKVNKWFKNARYLALKARRQAEGAQATEDACPCSQKETISETAKDSPDQMTLNNNTAPQNPKSFKTFARRRNNHLQENSLKMNQWRKPNVQRADSDQMAVDLGDDESLKHLREKVKEAKKSNCKKRSATQEAEAEMERLCQIKSRVEKLQQVLLQFPSWRPGKPGTSTAGVIIPSHSSVILVPVAELREIR